ncbi:MAG: Rab proteins geranylgeranyltransferase component A [Bathelium mastoideum]|nr:MAG: Rab proteins geranylgeranyltransferase component A [Bathelium mastoideum]
MESLDGTSWDVLISGTGLQQSLLALALSRSDKKILHLDQNGYYGGQEAAFSLQEAEEWAEHNRNLPSYLFQNAAILTDILPDSQPALSFSRAYSLALAPQIIYTRSPLLQTLVSSKVYRQLEFQALGNWYIFKPDDLIKSNSSGDTRLGGEQNGGGYLVKVPNGREDIFLAEDIDLRAKRSLMNFLRFVGDFENQTEKWDSYRTQPLPVFLIDQYRIPEELHEPLLALTLSPNDPEATTTEFALPRIARHLRSIGVFGSGFGAVIPKWGGLAEISQVACRAGAVGGTVYVLNRAVRTIASTSGASGDDSTLFTVTLDDGSVVKSSWVVGTHVDLPPVSDEPRPPTVSKRTIASLSRSVSIVASPMTSVLPPVAENAPVPAGTLVVFPTGSLVSEKTNDTNTKNPPVHVIIHSSDTAILYASTAAVGDDAFALLETAVHHVLKSVGEHAVPRLLWSMRYEQSAGHENATIGGVEGLEVAANSRILRFNPTSLDLALDDSLLERVKSVWQEIMGPEASGFMEFEDRLGTALGDDGDVV